jgi:hypothetical protein
LITGDINFKTLSKQIDHDLHELGQSITNLESSLDSLAEMVLQNWRGLDLLFLKQGGLCVALGETCCFYTSHSGVIKNSITLVRKNLKDREDLHKSSGNWYQNLFSWSP